MPYATQQDLETRYGARELAAVSARNGGPAGVVDAVVVAQALADATAVVDSYLGTRYAVPLSEPAPPRITEVACQIARYRLHEQRANERVRQDYDEAMAFLRDAAMGRAVVPGLSPAQPPAGDGTGSGVPGVAAPAVTFTDAVLQAMP